MKPETLVVEQDGPLAVVTLNRTRRLNTLSVECLREIKEVFPLLQADPEIRAVILYGGPEFFSAGMDLKDKEVHKILSGSLDERLSRVKAGPEACQAVEDVRPVTIAAIEGFCLGGGVSLAISCDFRIMAQTAYMRVPEIDLGLNYSWGSIPRLVRLVGPARAKQAIILCEEIPADKCLAWGLAEEVTPPGQALTAALDMARRVAAKPPLPVAMTKEAVNRYSVALDRCGVYMDGDQFLLTAYSEDHAEGLKAFLEKREGRFKGR